MALQMKSGTNSTCDPYLSHLGCISNLPRRKSGFPYLREHSQGRRELGPGSPVSVRKVVMRPNHLWYFCIPTRHSSFSSLVAVGVVVDTLAMGWYPLCLSTLF